jgi:hypothetical protein
VRVNPWTSKKILKSRADWNQPHVFFSVYFIISEEFQNNWRMSWYWMIWYFITIASFVSLDTSIHSFIRYFYFLNGGSRYFIFFSLFEAKVIELIFRDVFKNWCDLQWVPKINFSEIALKWINAHYSKFEERSQIKVNWYFLLVCWIISIDVRELWNFLFLLEF